MSERERDSPRHAQVPGVQLRIEAPAIRLSVRRQAGPSRPRRADHPGSGAGSCPAPELFGIVGPVRAGNHGCSHSARILHGEDHGVFPAKSWLFRISKPTDEPDRLAERGPPSNRSASAAGFGTSGRRGACRLVARLPSRREVV